MSLIILSTTFFVHKEGNVLVPWELFARHQRGTQMQLILPAPSPLSRTETWLTIPLALWRGSHPDAGVVEPFVWAVLVVTGHHVPVGNLVADAVSWLVGIIIPFLV